MVKPILSTTDHNRDVAGLSYVYPVISRRAGGVSIGINFNTNNACNWRCIYCQVPDLAKGAAPSLDFSLLANELNAFLEQVKNGTFYEHYAVPENLRVIKDIAVSGNGEPTSLPDFASAIRLVGDIASKQGIFPGCHFVLITNGSLMHQQKVQQGLAQMNRFGGEVWFKLDSATRQGREVINHNLHSDRKVLEQLRISALLCQTKLQTCLLNYQQFPWTEREKRAYLGFLKQITEADINVKEILLYSIARPSQQPEAKHLDKIPENKMRQFAERIEQLGFKVRLSV